MIIDLIVDRKHKLYEYKAREFYIECMLYSSTFSRIGDDITYAMDYGNENSVRNAICKYIEDNGYSPDLCDYVRSVNWLD